jgi:hypothetical protein
MSKQQKKFEKRKARQKEVKQKLRIKRETKHQQEKELRQEAKDKDAYTKVVNERLKLEHWISEAEGKIPEEVEDRIRHNISILKALEEEAEAELKARIEAREARERAERENKPDKTAIRPDALWANFDGLDRNDPNIFPAAQAWKDSCVEAEGATFTVTSDATDTIALSDGVSALTSLSKEKISEGAQVG